MPILDVQHIEKHFGATRVLEDISFSLEQGQALAIIGSSGSGKTTLLRCLNFLEKPDQGRILVNGEKLFDADDPATQTTLSRFRIRGNSSRNFPKKNYRLKLVTDETGLTVKGIRFYEKIGLIRPAERSPAACRRPPPILHSRMTSRCRSRQEPGTTSLAGRAPA